MPVKRRRTETTEYKDGDISSTAKSLMSLKKRLMRLEKAPEKRFHDVTVSGTIGTTMSVNALSAIAEGDTDDSRAGHIINPKSLYVRYSAKANATGASSAAEQIIVRFMVVQDLRHSSAAPTAAEILEGSATVYDFLEVNDATRGAFKVLMDDTVALSWSGNGCYFNKRYIKLKGKTYYDGVNATDYAKGNYWVCVVSDNNTYPASYQFDSRLGYTDE